jgi:hypothetical protein
MMTPEEREFWLEFRRGILQINLALERRLQVGKYEPVERSLGPFPLKPPRNGQEESPAPRGRRT